MSFSESLLLVLLAVLVVLAPVGVIGVSASKLDPNQRSEFITLYAALLVLLGVVAADELALVPYRLAVDLVLLVGGLALGAFARPFVAALWSGRRRAAKPN
jgi:hypothetical protein